jgi:small nuclear ribonucleoprotein (snRNP)-like protein
MIIMTNDETLISFFFDLLERNDVSDPTMARGIQNVSGVSCHISCALQIICHVLLIPLRLKEVAASSSNGNIKKSILSELGTFGHALAAENGEAIDPSSLFKSLKRLTSLEPNDVGDVSTAIYKLLQVMIRGDDNNNNNNDWALLVLQKCIHGETRQVIVGTKNSKETYQTVIRTKKGKPKLMACPFPLVGTFDSVERALNLAVAPQTVSGYNWERQSAESYKEDHVETLSRDDSDSDNEDEDWKTVKSMNFESLPNYLFLSLERFTYDQELKVLSNPLVQIPASLDVSEYATNNNSTGTLQLKGGVLHVSDGAIEEEGHYVTVLREDDSSWILMDDEVCKPIDEDRARNLLSGAHDEDGQFFCGTLVVYGNDEEDPEMVQLLDDLKRKAAAAAEGTNETMSSDSSNPEAIVGRRLRVKWAKGKLYTGIVESYDESTGKHTIKYKDGDVRAYILAKKTIEWL